MMNLSHHPDYKPKEGCGCGADRAAFDYVPDSFFFGLADFKPACCIHDDRYERGGTEEDKIEADRELLNNLLTIVESVKQWYFPTFLGRRRALDYYEAVIRAGQKSFNYHDKGVQNVGSNAEHSADDRGCGVGQGYGRSDNGQYRVQRSRHKSKRGV